MDHATLQGKRKEVYILMKILKKVTGADVTSYLIKWAIQETLKYVRPQDISLESALKMVLEHRALRGKFSGVATTFKDMGVKEIEILQHGLRFVGFSEML